MGRQHLQPQTFGRHAVKWPDTLFEIRIVGESDPERIREAIKAEAHRSSPRTERVAMCNQRLAELS